VTWFVKYCAHQLVVYDHGNTHIQTQTAQILTAFCR